MGRSSYGGKSSWWNNGIVAQGTHSNQTEYSASSNSALQPTRKKRGRLRFSVRFQSVKGTDRAIIFSPCIEESPMNYPVIIRTESAHQYVAQPLGIPEVKVVAATEAEAIAQVTEALAQWLTAAKVVHVAVPGEARGNPWLDAFGRSADDPDFAEFLEELQRLRTMDTSA